MRRRGALGLLRGCVVVASGLAMGVASASVRAAVSSPFPLIDLDTATQAQLEQVRGIGVAMSERLLKARAEAPFTDWPDLMRRVAGIGPKMAQRLSMQGVTVKGLTYAPVDAPACAGTTASGAAH